MTNRPDRTRQEFSGELGYHERVRDLALKHAIAYADTCNETLTVQEILDYADVFESHFKRGITSARKALDALDGGE